MNTLKNSPLRIDGKDNRIQMKKMDLKKSVEKKNTCHFVDKVVDPIHRQFLLERQKANISIYQDNFDKILIDKAMAEIIYEK